VAGRGLGGTDSISRWRAKTSAMPASARPSNWSSSPRLKATPSAVPWTSMNLPSPVMTTFMSTSAEESST